MDGIQRRELVTDGAVLSSSNLLPVGGKLVRVTATFTRPDNVTAYGVGDVVSNDATTTVLMEFASFARVVGGSGYVVGAILATDKKSIVPVMRVHLFNASNPTVAGDNAQHKGLYADIGKLIGAFDLEAMTTPVDAGSSDLSVAMADGKDIIVPFVAGAATRSIFALLETQTAFTPAALENFSLTLIGDLN